MKLSKDTIIGDLLDSSGSCREVFEALDMHCLDCPASRGETLEEACEIHGVELDALMEKLKEHLGE